MATAPKKKPNKYSYLYVVQGHYGIHGWEDLTQSEDRKEARADLKSYRENEQAQHRMIKRRVLNEAAASAA